MAYTAEEIIQLNGKLTALPETLVELNLAVNQADVTIAEISEIIGRDVGLSTHLLKIVNSPFYGFPSKVDTISMAVNIVGTNQLRYLALSTVMLQKFKNIPATVMTAEGFWHHSFTCATIARALAAHHKDIDPEYIFTAGLLHDIGRLLMFINLPEEAKEAIDHAMVNKTPAFLAEREIIGIDHAQLGRALAEHWHFPAALIEPIGAHHDISGELQFPRETAIVHLANSIASSIKPSIYLPHSHIHSDVRVWDLAHMNPNALHDILDDIETRVEETMKTITRAVA